jgi:Mn-dependent DtxR family transcriptional regulator
MSALDKILWLLFHSDGVTGLYEIAGRMNLHPDEVMETAKFLEDKGILFVI